MMVALLTNIVSPHQLPLAREIVKLVGVDNYRYVYTESFHAERARMGWGDGSAPEWCKPLAESLKFLHDADLVYCEERNLKLFAKRALKGLKTVYVSERWLKPPIGILRLLNPRYFSMVLKMVRMLRDDPKFFYYPQGIRAARDMARLCGLMHGDWKCLFRAPELEFERRPGGKIWISGGVRSEGVRELGKKYCLDKMRMFCYTVAPSVALPGEQKPRKPDEVRVLWVGRLLAWKRVDTIVRAVSEHAALKRVDNSLSKTTLDIYGSGPEEKRLKQMAKGHEDIIKFYPSVPIAEVRKLMREHDVYVLSSNGYEGWGAVVSEALEEGMRIIGTYEAGSSATILPESCLYHAGDWRRLAKLLASDIPKIGIGEWTASKATEALLQGE